MNDFAVLIFLDIASIACGDDQPARLTDSGLFETPEDPDTGNYPDDMDCSWSISAPAGQNVKLEFETFELEQHSRCRYDKVEVIDGNNGVLGPFCGDEIPNVIVSTGSSLLVK